jgi:thiol-disulfide isomerase/thioredoxin
MKKILLSAFALGTLIATAQNVSTTTENKNVVLEEFTGIYCGYCPDGHRLAQEFHDNNPGDVVLINIHTGSYATPQGSDPDYQTSFGPAIAGQTDLQGFPAGTINRHLFAGLSQQGGSGTAMSRGDFEGAGDQILLETSVVNVWGDATVDLGTGIISVDVEVYYTGTQTITSNNLNVVILQNNVEGPQSGSSANPNSVLPNGNYNHNHMLRHLMTGQWGEQLDTITQGTLITRTYTWNLPSDINGVALDPTNLDVAIFVTEDQQEVLSGDMASKTIIFPNTDDASLSTSLATDLSCSVSSTDLTIKFQNFASATLTSLDIEYSINGGAATTYPWTGSLASGAFETVTINGVNVTANATNTVDFTLLNPNGVADQNSANNTQSTTFSGVAVASSGQASIDITTDNYGSETTWTLKNSSGTTIASGGPYADGSTTAQATVNASLDGFTCYTFTILDSYGDGIDAGYGVGSYTITDAAGVIVATGGQFGTEDNASFETGAVSAVNDISSNFSIFPNPVKDVLTIEGNYTSVDIIDVSGKLVLSSEAAKNINIKALADGVYMLNIKTENGIAVKKITITK